MPPPPIIDLEDPFQYYPHLRLGYKSFSLRLPTKTVYEYLLSPVPAPCSDHLILGFITRKIMGEEDRSLSSSLCSFLHSPVTSSLLGQNMLLSTLFSNTFNLRSSLNAKDQVSYPHKTTDKITVLYILIFHIFGYQTGRQNILHPMITSIP